jgi:hypothetical protein
MFNLLFSPPLGDFVISPVSVFSIAPTLQLLLLHSQQQNLYGKGEPVDQFPSDWGLGPASAPSFGKLMQGLPRGRHILVAPGSQKLVFNENFFWLPWMLLKLKITSDPNVADRVPRTSFWQRCSMGSHVFRSATCPSLAFLATS